MQIAIHSIEEAIFKLVIAIVGKSSRGNRIKVQPISYLPLAAETMRSTENVNGLSSCLEGPKFRTRQRSAKGLPCYKVCLNTESPVIAWKRDFTYLRIPWCLVSSPECLFQLHRIQQTLCDTIQEQGSIYYLFTSASYLKSGAIVFLHFLYKICVFFSSKSE